MNRVMRGSVLLAAAIGLFACKGDPTGDLRNGVDHLIATPSALFVTYQGADSIQNVLVEAVDAQGNRVEADFPPSITPTTADITVTFDVNYNPVFSGSDTPGQPSHTTRAQYIVQAMANTGNSGFTVSAGGKSITIPVRIVPATVSNLTLSNAAPSLGDTVVATAGTGFLFTPTSLVSVPGASVITLGISADSTQISFVPGPSGNGAVSVDKMVLSYATAVGGYTASSGATVLVTPAITSIAATFSSATPAVGTTITVTLPAAYKFVNGGGVDFGGAAGYTPVVAADSNSITVIPVPGYTGPVTLQNAALSFLLGAPVTVPTTTNITVGAGQAGTDDPLTAPLLTIPTVGNSNSFYDNGDPFAGAVFGADRVYNITLGAPATLTFNVDWNNTADVDILFATSGLGLISCFGGATGAHPENSTCSLPAGTSYLVLDLYAGTAPSMVKVTVSQ